MKLRALALLLLALPAFAADKDKSKTRSLPPHPVQLTAEGEKWAEKTLKKLSLEEKIGQLLMVRALAEFQNAQSPAYLELRDQLAKYHLGSVLLTVRIDSNGLLLRNQPYEAAMTANQLQRDSDLPLLVAADFERGASMRLGAVPAFPAAMAFGAAGDPQLANRFAQVVARESRALGVHWNFYPIADVNSNPLNPVINTRSYGEDPQRVGDLVVAYINGSRQGGLLSTAKHFPGHGDTDTDSHLEFARVNGSLERLHAVELPPFQRAIDAGVDSVMVAHVTAPALEPQSIPATVSHNIVTGLLREQMHFGGLIVTDALDMHALTNAFPGDPHTAAGNAAVAALKAGNDLVLLPSELDGAYQGMLQAARSGQITAEELDQRVLRVLRAKASLDLYKARLVDIEQLRNDIGRPEDFALAQQVADAAITLVRDNHQAIAAIRAQRPATSPGTSAAPFAYGQAAATAAAPSGLVVVILTDDLRSEMGRTFEREVKARVPQATVIPVDPRIADAMLPTVLDATGKASAVVLAAFSVPTAGKVEPTANGMHNSVSLSGGNAAVVQRVLETAGDKTTTIALGNPYLALDFPSVQTYICTFSGFPTSETAAVKAIFGEVPIRGHLPVTLPGIAARGQGLMAQAQPAQRARALAHSNAHSTRLARAVSGGLSH